MSNINPLKSAAEIVKGVQVNSVLSPFLWLLGLLTVGFVFSSNIWIQVFLMFMIACIVVSFVLFFRYILLFKDPNLLRSEKHVYKMKVLEIIGDQKHVIEDSQDSIKENNPMFPNPNSIKISDPKNIKPPENKR